MQQAGWESADRKKWDWAENSAGGFEPPEGFRTATRGIVESIQRHIHELMVGNLLTNDDGGVSPKYQQLTDLYMEVLSADVR